MLSTPSHHHTAGQCRAKHNPIGNFISEFGSLNQRGLVLPARRRFVPLQLEDALRSVPKDAGDRWDQIAARVDGKTKKQCKIRVKELMAYAKQK